MLGLAVGRAEGRRGDRKGHRESQAQFAAGVALAAGVSMRSARANAKSPCALDAPTVTARLYRSMRPGAEPASIQNNLRLPAGRAAPARWVTIERGPNQTFDVTSMVQG
jgi:hypothetical protein